MSKARFYCDDAIEDMNDQLRDMMKKVENPDKMLGDIGDVIYAKVYQELAKHVSNKHHVHMRDDIVTRVKTSVKGDKYVTVHGGSETGYKWHIINDGHYANNFVAGKHGRKIARAYKAAGMKNKFVPGTHFMDNAVANSEVAVEYIINEYCEDIVE